MMQRCRRKGREGIMWNVIISGKWEGKVETYKVIGGEGKAGDIQGMMQGTGV